MLIHHMLIHHMRIHHMLIPHKTLTIRHTIPPDTIRHTHTIIGTIISTIFTTFLQHIHHMLVSYLHHVYMHRSHASYVHHIYTTALTYILFASMYIIFTSYLHHMYIIFTSYLHQMYRRSTCARGRTSITSWKQSPSSLKSSSSRVWISNSYGYLTAIIDHL
jgi:predicted membrane protein